MSELDRLDADIAQAEASFSKRINEERTARFKMADEQRNYVDRADKVTRGVVNIFTGRGFWSRINWLLTGR